MGLGNKAVGPDNLVKLTDEVKDVAGVSIEDVLAYMKENRIVKIVVTPEPGKFRLVFPLPDRNIYEATLGK